MSAFPNEYRRNDFMRCPRCFTEFDDRLPSCPVCRQPSPDGRRAGNTLALAGIAGSPFVLALAILSTLMTVLQFVSIFFWFPVFCILHNSAVGYHRSLDAVYLCFQGSRNPFVLRTDPVYPGLWDREQQYSHGPVLAGSSDFFCRGGSDS